jgi:hypothetical protein
MSGIRWIPKYTVQATSPEVKKSIQIYRFGIRNSNCCKPIQKFNFLSGGTPSAGGPSIKDGGTPLAGGPKIYNGGKP